MSKKMNILSMIICPALLCCCGAGQDADEGLQPALRLEVVSADASSVTVSLKTVNAAGAAVICLDASAETPSAEALMDGGSRTSDAEYTIGGLSDGTSYNVYGVAYDSKGRTGAVQEASFSTSAGVGELYPFEASRSGLLTYDNLDLCYGGSKHRSPYVWNEDRWSKQCFYTDADGLEHWLFDAFLAIEFVSTQNNMSLNLGQSRPSADKACWQELIDYWFDPDYGFAALDKVVGDGIGRIGAPAKRRKVVMVIPDAIPYQNYKDVSSSTTYWGRLDGVQMDFSKASHRQKAIKWYIDEVRARWNAAGFTNIDLAGFYIVSEDLAVPGHGWSSELKHWEDIYPDISDYLHSANESVSWIPYYAAGAYQLWSDFHIDYAMMQPNYFWGTKYPPYTISTFKQMVTDCGMSMELEMDDAMIGSGTAQGPYRARFREYMQLCKDLGLYGRRELSYYMGGDSFYNLATSTIPEDVALYREFCEFLMGHEAAR